VSIEGKVIAGNWKMYKTRREAVSLCEAFLDGIAAVPPERELLVFPPFTAVAAVAERCQGSRIRVGGQNLHPSADGAFTGEISARMLLEAGATHVLIGHSERRQVFREADDFLAQKVRTALTAGLIPLFCVGETLEQRQGGTTEAVIREQITRGLGTLDSGDLGRLLIAYEPVWAIGTGVTATPEQARDAHHFLRGELRTRWGTVADRLPLLYGGSVKPGNAGTLLAQPDVDGLLVGGASLEGASFLSIACA
jgi:triosephosphate isomerase (TIM)